MQQHFIYVQISGIDYDIIMLLHKYIFVKTTIQITCYYLPGFFFQIWVFSSSNIAANLNMTTSPLKKQKNYLNDTTLNNICLSHSYNSLYCKCDNLLLKSRIETNTSTFLDSARFSLRIHTVYIHFKSSYGNYVSEIH